MALLARRYAKLPPEILAYRWSEIRDWWSWDELATGADR